MWSLFPVSLVAAVFTLSVLEHPRGAGQCAVPRAGPGLLLASPDHEIVWSLDWRATHLMGLERVNNSALQY